MSPLSHIAIIKKPAAVLFDFDGVIGDTMKDNYAAWHHAFTVYGALIDKEDYFLREGYRPQDYSSYFAVKHGIAAENVETIMKIKSTHFKKIHTPRLYPDSVELLNWLIGMKIPFGIVSGGSKERLENLLPVRILKACGVIMHAENTKKPKPDPQPFLAAAEVLGVAPESCLVIENAPFGISAARTAGMQCAAVTTTLPAEKLKGADAVFASVGDIKTVLEKLFTTNTKRLCPVCAGDKKQFLLRQRFSRIAGNPDMSYDLVLCRRCGACFADSVPSQKAYDRYYKKMSKYEDVQGSGRNSAIMTASHKRVASVVSRYAKNKRTAVLDVGCATGDTLNEFKRAGYSDVYGIDPSPVCSRIAREKYNITVEATGLNTIKTDREYGVVTLSHVLEHIVDMPRAMNKIRALVAPGGFIYVEVPAAHRFMEKPDGFFEHFSVEHVNYFSPATLERLMSSYGFKKRKMITTLNRKGFYPAFPVIISVWQKTGRRNEAAGKKDTQLGREIKRYISHCKRAVLPVRKKIDLLMKAKKKIIVWGAGSHTLKLLENTNLGKVPIAAIVDDTVSLQGRSIQRWRVSSPQEVLPAMPFPILVSSMHFQEQIAQRISNALRLKNKLIRLY